MLVAYYIYEARMSNGERFSVAISAVRLPSLQEEIARGLKLMTLVEPLYITTDRNEVRRLADCEM